MNRQLYMSGGIMNIVPREQALLGGIKKAVKKVTKGVKDIASSDLGKAALTAAAMYYAPGIGIKAQFGPGISGLKAAGIAGKSALGNFFLGTPGDMGGRVAGTDLLSRISKGIGFGSGTGKGSGFLTKGLALAGVSTFLTKTLGMSEVQAEEELARDPSKYLELYYRNLNPPTADTNSEEYEAQVREFVTTNTSEYAVGGRVGFADGPVLPPDPTQPVNPFGPKPGDFGIEEDIPIKMASNIENDKILEALFEKYIDMGLSPKDAAEAAQKEFERMSMMKTEEGRGLAALGGRIGYSMGSDIEKLERALEEDDIQGLAAFDNLSPLELNELLEKLREKKLKKIKQKDLDSIYDMGRMGAAEGTPMGLQGLGSIMDEEDMVVLITYDEDGNRRLIPVPRSSVIPDMKTGKDLPLVFDDKMDSEDIVIPMDKEKILEGIVPRNNKATGDSASMNAMQAAGIEGLPIRQNPKGVKELDLRKTGGFIQPVGIKEKEDDIPAMLSNNEFVFTADAVRGAGGGDVNLGAQRMYDTMKRLEAGGKV